jgi:hypothetical protein
VTIVISKHGWMHGQMLTGSNDMSRGNDEEIRVARLGLARVSIVRGEGPLAGQPCVDDYIILHEPVADYLTRFSGIVRVLSYLGSSPAECAAM